MTSGRSRVGARMRHGAAVGRRRREGVRVADPPAPRRPAARRGGTTHRDRLRGGGPAGRVLADPTRARLLYVMDAVDELCALDAPEDAVGYGLRVLRTAGLVTTRKECGWCSTACRRVSQNRRATAAFVRSWTAPGTLARRSGAVRRRLGARRRCRPGMPRLGRPRRGRGLRPSLARRRARPPARPRCRARPGSARPRSARRPVTARRSRRRRLRTATADSDCWSGQASAVSGGASGPDVQVRPPSVLRTRRQLQLPAAVPGAAVVAGGQ